LGTASLANFDVQPRKHAKTTVHIDLPRITASVGLSILKEMIQTDGILSVNVKGNANAKSMGMKVNIDVECIQVVDTFKIPTKIIGGNCTYTYH